MGAKDARGRQLPGEEAWLVGERRASGKRKYYLTNLPPRTSLRKLAATIKARWSGEQAHQQLKEELRLDHCEGRSWLGLQHHLLLTQIAFAFLQRLRARRSFGADAVLLARCHGQTGFRGQSNVDGTPSPVSASDTTPTTRAHWLRDDPAPDRGPAVRAGLPSLARTVTAASYADRPGRARARASAREVRSAPCP
jgi:hypothetical protein